MISVYLLLDCSARALSNGCKSRVSPNSGNYIAKGKGVHREVKSERSWRQTSDLTNRNRRVCYFNGGVSRMVSKIGTAVCGTARTVV